MNGTTWDVLKVERVTDGDSVRLLRARVVELDGRRYRLSDVDSVPIRLVWLDTPERGEVGYREARAHVLEWLTRLADPPLTVTCYESAGWDRLLGDVHAADGSSLSQWLMVDRGWPAYEARS